jgi:hypothetical protein
VVEQVLWQTGSTVGLEIGFYVVVCAARCNSL